MLDRGLCTTINGICNVVKRDACGIIAYEYCHGPSTALRRDLPLDAVVGVRPGHGVELRVTRLRAVEAQISSNIGYFLEQNVLRRRPCFVVVDAIGRLLLNPERDVVAGQNDSADGGK